MGGRIGRPVSTPICLPVRIVLINISAVHEPSPVVESGVRLAGYEIPHGPTHEVRSGPARYQLPGLISFALNLGSLLSAGCPLSGRLLSTSILPSLVNVFGEWQSLQPPRETRY